MIGNNDEVINYFAELNKKDIKITGRVNINTAEIKELITLIDF